MADEPQDRQPQKDRASGENTDTVEEPVEPTYARKVMSLAMRIGDTLLSAGMPANDVVVMMLHVAEAYGLSRVHFDVTHTAIAVTYYPGRVEIPLTAIRVVESEVVDYTEVQGLDRLSDQIRDGLPIDEARREYDRLHQAPLPYPQWAAMVGNAGVAAAVSMMFGWSWKVVLITFVTGCLVDRFVSVLPRFRFPSFFRQAAAASLITLVAAGISTAAIHGVPFFVGVDPTLVVVGTIIMLVAGMMFVGAAQDAIDEFYVTATARLLEVMIWTAGIVVGIVVALYLTRRLGIPVALAPEPVTLGPLPVQYIGATLTSAAFALACYASPGAIALSGAMGLIGWVGYALSIQAGAGEVLACTVGALAAALVTTLFIRRTNVPGFALITAALIPLVPGLSLYIALFQMVGVTPGSGQLYEGLLTLFEAAGVALGMAAGASFGTYLGRPMADHIRRIRDRANRTFFRR
ncbi:MAG: threonine/serine ThrE exporter family protein [Anaerolineae bacterium]